jgi:hypothetical protein
MITKPKYTPSGKLTRGFLLELLKVAGYHFDTAAFTRLYIENRISREAANTAYMLGVRMKWAGVPCSCVDCRKAGQAEKEKNR